MSRPPTSPPRRASDRRAAVYVVGPQWHELGFRQTGCVLLPLRAFLSITFIVAALQKLANPEFFDPQNPTSFAATTRSLEHTSPIGPLLGVALHAPGPVGLLIALGELAVGVGTLLGLWARLAATGGLLLSLTFFLTVSWNTSPYYYGADIVFLFAWTPFIAVGAAGVLSTDALVRQRARRTRGLPAEAGERNLRPDIVTDIDRRALLTGARLVGLAAVGAAVMGGVAAVVGRLIGGTAHHSTAARQPPQPTLTTSSSAARPRRTHRHSRAVGTPIGPASAVRTGNAASFRDPSNGQPAYVVHEPGGSFAAFSAVCTHAGCTVGFDASAQQFVCPCHGGAYSARTGQVVAGPPPAPLSRIQVVVHDGELRVV
jgi:thiosulfate dehydrogenase [quinone] large subunit